MTATTLLNLELQCGIWRVTGWIPEDQLGKWSEERLRVKMKKLWPSLPYTQQTARLKATVRLAQLQLMRTPKGEKVEIIRSLAMGWKSFGTLLDFDADGTTLNLIEVEQKVPIACCQEMFQKWLAGSGRQPVTWELLLELLEDVEQICLIGQIKQALSL